MTRWDFILEGRCSLRDTMAKDIELFESVRSGSVPGVLRMYNWLEPAVTVGFLQKRFSFHDPDLAVPVLKRPTGGGAVLHGDDITFSMSMETGELFPSHIPECSARISAVFEKALRKCSVDVQAQGGRHEFSEVCFARPSPVELMMAGSKIMGLALLRKSGVFLVQGVIPLRVDAGLSERVFGPRLGKNPTGLLDLEPSFSADAFVAALRDVFLSELGVFLPDGDEEDRQRHDADGGKIITGGKESCHEQVADHGK